MITRISSTLLLTFALLPAGLHAASITVWEHENFAGNQGVFDRSVSAIASTGWNDRISSLRVDSGEWEVCRDNDFRNCRTLSAGTSLSKLDGGWNDAISSVRPVSATAVTTDAQGVAARIYRGLLGREADPDGLNNATAQIQAGRLTDLVRNITGSPEFRNLSQQRSASELLDQIYRGLLGRGSDSAARTAFLSRIERGEAAEVTLDIIASDEFGGTGGGAAVTLPSTASGDEYRTRGQGNGSVTLGTGRPQSIHGAKIAIGADGRLEINFAGSTPATLTGTYTREANGTLNIRTIDLNGRSLAANGVVTFTSKDWLQRIDLTAGTPGTRDSVVARFDAVR